MTTDQDSPSSPKEFELANSIILFVQLNNDFKKNVNFHFRLNFFCTEFIFFGGRLPDPRSQFFSFFLVPG